MNIISNTAWVRLFLVIPMAEGVACVDGNGSFDIQTDEAAPPRSCPLHAIPFLHNKLDCVMISCAHWPHSAKH